VYESGGLQGVICPFLAHVSGGASVQLIVNQGAQPLNDALVSSGNGSTPLVPSAGTYSVASNGRGTLSFTVNTGSGNVTVDVVFYVVSAKKLFLLTTDPTTGSNSMSLLSGSALQQTVANGSFSNATLNGNAVLWSEGLVGSTNGSTTTYSGDVQVDVVTFDGAGSISLSGDENSGGMVTTNSGSATYSVAAKGRVTLTGAGSHPLSFYLVGSNQAFALDFSSSTHTGYLEPQTISSFSQASLSGTLTAGNLSSGFETGASIGAFPSTGTGSVSRVQDQNDVNTLNPDQSVSATDNVGPNGRVTLGGGGSGTVLYIVSPTKRILIDLGRNSPQHQELKN
jgi:hypothetical protein